MRVCVWAWAYAKLMQKLSLNWILFYLPLLLLLCVFFFLYEFCLIMLTLTHHITRNLANHPYLFLFVCPPHFYSNKKQFQFYHYVRCSVQSIWPISKNHMAVMWIVFNECVRISCESIFSLFEQFRQSDVI